MRELIVDSFAGGGGASTGIVMALGRNVDLAINHSHVALSMHARNHPHTRHLCEDVWAVDPAEATEGQPVGLAWFSPDCTHHSKAKGGKPRSKKVRGLAWVVTRWARAVRPRVIILENVEEFADWGPLTRDGHPMPERRGETFRAFVGKLRRYGYTVEWRELVAADYGAPTTRRRLFLIARCDGAPIVWPEPTHGKGRPRPWRTAAEVIDWSLPVRSIFGRERPLAEATLRRIAAGLRRFVLESGSPFVVPLTHHGPPRTYPLTEPLRTVTAANRGELALVAPTLVQTGYGERPGQAPRVPGLHKPLGTVVCDQKHALVTAFLAKHYTTSTPLPGIGMDAPAATVTTRDHHALVTALLTSHYGASVGRAADTPVPTVTAGGGGHHAVTTAFLTKFYGTSIGAEPRAPLPTITASGQHLAEVRAFLVKYYGAAADGQAVTDPLHTVTSKARFGLVTVAGEDYEIADIGMRMLSPRELYRAQGFSDAYIIDESADGKPLTKTQQIELCGNSVCPQLAEALVRANVRLGRREVAA